MAIFNSHVSLPEGMWSSLIQLSFVASLGWPSGFPSLPLLSEFMLAGNYLEDAVGTRLDLPGFTNSKEWHHSDSGCWFVDFDVSRVDFELLKVAPGQSNHWIKPWQLSVRSCLQISPRVLSWAASGCGVVSKSGKLQSPYSFHVVIGPHFSWLVIMHWCVATELSGQSFVDWAHCQKHIPAPKSISIW